MANTKILACGDVKGRIGDLMKRLVSMIDSEDIIV